MGVGVGRYIAQRKIDPMFIHVIQHFFAEWARRLVEKRVISHVLSFLAFFTLDLSVPVRAKKRQNW